MDRKNLLLNTSKNEPQVFNNLMNSKVYWAFIDTKYNIQSFHSLASTQSGLVCILGEELDSNQRVLLSDTTTVTSCFVSIDFGNKEDAIHGNLQFLDKP